jgi:hypothetical protein
MMVVTAVCVLLTAVQWGPQPDANIGAGFVLMLLDGLGLPWSVLTLVGELSEQREYVRTVASVSFALINLTLHGIVALLFSFRRVYS